MHHTTCIVWTLGLLVSILPRSFRSDSEAEHSGLFVLASDKIYKIDLETSEKTAISDGLKEGAAIDYNLEKGVLVVSDIGEGCLYKVKIDTGNKEVLATGEIRSPEGVAMDWIHGNVYWTDAGTRTISIISLDGKLRKALIDRDLSIPTGIVVNPLEGWMFWSDWGHKTIERSGMDGSQRSRIVPIGASAYGLALDFDSRKIYWVDTVFKSISSSDYDGSNVKEIFHSTTAVGSPNALDLFQDWMFWDERATGKVYKAKKLTGESSEVVASGFYRPAGIRFLHSTKQPKGINYCEENGECSHFCLPAPRITEDSKNFTCACPDGMSLTEDEKNCKGPSSTSPATHTTNAEQTSINSSSPISCGGNLTDHNGEISSPRHPEQYPHDTHCTWRITAPDEHRIRLRFSRFSLEVDTPTCQYNYVSVEDGGGSELGKFCGKTVPPVVKSLNNIMTVTFYRYKHVSNDGFLATYDFFNASESCGGSRTQNNSEIFSPRHPEDYPPNISCEWRIIAPEGYVIRLTFSSFDLEVQINCDYDYVMVHETEGGTIGKFCGDEKPPVIMSLNNILIVEFHSDPFNSKPGFKARYEYLPKSIENCGGNLTASNGEISSPMYPHPYPPNLYCMWLIKAPLKYKIQLTFSNFSLEESDYCRNDYVVVEETEGNSIGRFCGTMKPDVITSKNRTLIVTFQSDRLYGDGFRAKYVFLPNQKSCGASHRTQNNSHIASPMYPRRYPCTVDCTWQIEAPVGHIIRLSFYNFSLEASEDCHKDYVSVEDNLEYAIGKFCGTQLPPVIDSENNTLTVTFHTDDYVIGYGFRAKYQFLPNPRICGGNITQMYSDISSPFYPQPYPHNADCTWRIKAPEGHRIRLTFLSFNLEDDSEICQFDYALVEEMEGNTIGKFCGSEIPPVITSLKNTLIVKFHSDHSDAGDGFEAIYEFFEIE